MKKMILVIYISINLFHKEKHANYNLSIYFKGERRLSVIYSKMCQFYFNLFLAYII